MKLNDEAEAAAFQAARVLAQYGIYEFMNADIADPKRAPEIPPAKINHKER